MASESLVIGARYCGPPGSANGGYAAGAVADFIAGDAVCTLRKPPPLDTAIDIRPGDDHVIAELGGEVIAEARPAPLEVSIPETVSWDEAASAEGKPPWRHDHAFPTCFVCGAAREPGDGLRIFPGLVPGKSVAAATWVPDAEHADASGEIRAPIVWAALDCPSWFGAIAAAPELEKPALLGRLAVHIGTPPRAGERWISMGWLEGADGRKIHARSALVRDDGVIGGVGAATWITLRG